MTFIVEPCPTGYRATSRSSQRVCAEGKTADEAIAAVMAKLTERDVSETVTPEIFKLDVDAIRKAADACSKDPNLREFQKAREEYRRQQDALDALEE